MRALDVVAYRLTFVGLLGMPFALVSWHTRLVRTPANYVVRRDAVVSHLARRKSCDACSKRSATIEIVNFLRLHVRCECGIERMLDFEFCDRSATITTILRR